MFGRALVRSLVTHYAREAGYSGPLRVYVDAERFQAVLRRRRDRLVLSHSRDWGVTSPGRVPVVWVNLATNLTIARLANTAAHEGLHVADPDLRHGREFTRRVRALLRGGSLEL